MLWWHCDTMFGSMIVSTFNFAHIVKLLEKHKYMEGASLWCIANNPLAILTKVANFFVQLDWILTMTIDSKINHYC